MILLNLDIFLSKMIELKLCYLRLRTINRKREERQVKEFLEKWSSLIKLNSVISVLISLTGITMYKKMNLNDVVLFLIIHTKLLFLSIIIIFIIQLLTLPYQKKKLDLLKEKFNLDTNLFKMAKSITFIVILSVFLNFVLQFFQFQLHIDPTIYWIYEHPKVFLLGSGLLFFIGLLLFSLIGEIKISNFIFTSLITSMGLIHYFKLKFRGEPFYPADILQFKHLGDVSEMVFSFLSLPYILLFITLFITIAFFLYVIPKYKIKWSPRIAFFLIAFFMVFSYLQYPKTFMKEVFANNLNVVLWNQLDNYHHNSAVMGFVLNVTADTVEKPSNFSDKTVEEITKKITQNAPSKQKMEPIKLEEKPHIIFLMSESFWDPTQMETVEFSEDPIPNIHSYMKKYTSGNILTPTFGGGTANVEFEALTGFSMNFIKEGAVPYQSLFNNKPFMPSIISQLKDDDYNTMAIHPYNKIFYKRNLVYKSLGFNDFLDMDKMKYTQYFGPYISDMALTKEIMDQIKNANTPTFIHAVSMQNHFDYSKGKYDKNQIKIDGLTSNDAYQLEVYTEGLRNTDIATKKLIDYLDTIDEPVILVFWGDHLPILGNNKSIYKNVNYANVLENESTNTEYFKTPFFIYTNYEMNHQHLGTLSANYLGPLTFEMTGKRLPPYYQFLKNVYEEIPGLKRDMKLDDTGEIIQNLSTKQQELLHDYEIIQYDLLVDEQVSLPKLFDVD